MMLIAQELERRTNAKELEFFYPDTGSFAREGYQRHIAMLEAGRTHTERVCMGGNRCGKTTSIGGYETALHLTGLYPDWWQGRRFSKPIEAWAAGTKNQKTRDINQKILIGKISKAGGFTQAQGGLIPAPKIVRLTRKTGVADAIDQVIVQHKDGYENMLTLKSYEEGRDGFQGEAIDWIWLDEECPLAVYTECQMRLITVNGAMMITFTPLEGMSDCVLHLLEDTEFL